MDTSSKVIWSREMTAHLIELLEASPPLWDVTSPDYKDKVKRQNCLEKIAQAMILSPNDIKSKILKLRTQYSNERNKMKRKVISGTGKKAKYVTKWEYFSSLNFLFQHETAQHENNDSMINTQEIHTKEAAKSNEDLFPEEISSPHFPSSETERAPNFNHRHRPNKRMHFAKKSSSKLQELEALNRCMTVISNARPTDEFSVFGDFVANELRNLKDAPDLQSKLKRSIQRNLLDVADEYAQRQDTSAMEYVQQTLPSPSFPASNVNNSEQKFNEI